VSFACFQGIDNDPYKLASAYVPEVTNLLIVSFQHVHQYEQVLLKVAMVKGAYTRLLRNKFKAVMSTLTEGSIVVAESNTGFIANTLITSTSVAAKCSSIGVHQDYSSEKDRLHTENSPSSTEVVRDNHLDYSGESVNGKNELGFEESRGKSYS
jgi:hypothetical protein